MGYQLREKLTLANVPCNRGRAYCHIPGTIPDSGLKVLNLQARDYLERTLVLSKGLVERAKQRLDKLCTLKTLLPEYFTWSQNITAEIKSINNIIPSALTPKTTDDHYRFAILKVITDDFDSTDVFVFYKFTIMVSEYLKHRDYCTGYGLILDYTEANILNFMTQVNPVTLRHATSIILEGYAFRIKGIYILTQSKMVGALVSLLKQVLSTKLISRIHVVPDIDALCELVPREILPVEYGGQEKPIKELCDESVEILTSQDFLSYYKEMAAATTDESRRQSDKFNQDYAGMPGSFRTLALD